MSFLVNLSSAYSYISFSLLIAYISYKVFDFYKRALLLPPGPTPLPFIGNILAFRTDSHWTEVMNKYIKEYGPVMTFWIGNKPCVFISDPDIGRQVFNKTEFSGRMTGYLAECLADKNRHDIVLNDFGPSWLALRKVTHAAAGKIFNKLAHLVCGCVDQTMNTIISKEGFNKEFVPFEYTYLLFNNIMTSNAFGRIEQDRILEITKAILKDTSQKYGPRILLWELSPLLRLIDWRAVRQHKQQVFAFQDLIFQLFKSHYKDYDPSIERDFCDALISAKNDALREDKTYTTHLTDDNLAGCIMNLFLAGVEPTKVVFDWILLLISYYPEIQKKLRQEIVTQIGDRIPTQEDRHRCHYVMAFISETLRLKNPIFLAIPHKALVTIKIGKHTIPEGTAVILLLSKNILIDAKYWSNPHEFRPERFLVNGEHINTGNTAYIPFGVGRRKCLGEKLTISDLFVVLVRFLQLTSNGEIVLGENSGLENDQQIAHFNSPKKFKIFFKNHHG